MAALASGFQEYGAWRDALRAAVVRLRDWLDEVQLLEPDAARRLDGVLLRLSEDRLVVVVVAEFSRGKSELINAIFFSEYGRRILPSAAGRTTMCPTELLFDETLPPCIRALPIETRAKTGATSDYRHQADEWQLFAVDTDSPDGMLAAIRLVAETKRVPVAEAIGYGLYDPDDPDQKLGVDAWGTLEISRWRHAIINFPHPLLKQGLVVLDTPGLNAIGAEPELTLALVPNAHAVLFVLGADTGVTKSDLDVWKTVVGDAGAGDQHIAVLNKIDGLWDALKTESEQEAEIVRQLDTVSHTLGLARERIFPVSAQKGLVAKVTGDARLLARSRLPALETALLDLLVPAKRQIVRNQTLAVIERLAAEVRARLSTRERQVREQLTEMRTLDGKNESAVTRLQERADAERKDFEAHLRNLVAARSVLGRLSDKALAPIERKAAIDAANRARAALQGSLLSLQVGAVVREFFAALNAALREANGHLREVEKMALAVQKNFAQRLGTTFTPPLAFTLDEYLAKLARAEAASRSYFGPLAVLTRDKRTLVDRFVDTVAAQAREILGDAERDAEAWIGSLLPPVEEQVRERRMQLKRRVESIGRIRGARETLYERITQLDDARVEARDKLLALAEHLAHCRQLAGAAAATA